MQPSHTFLQRDKANLPARPLLITWTVYTPFPLCLLHAISVDHPEVHSALAQLSWLVEFTGVTGKILALVLPGTCTPGVKLG
jgi:hypothetical protein